jgi:molybdopterin-synthase adenylyltransferase
MGILDRQSIADEVRRYGAAEGRPQVVWPNGILASTAIGLFVQLVAPWHEHPISTAYLEYDGNSHTLKPGNRLAALAGRRCSHFHPAYRGGTRGRIGERAFFTAYVPLLVSCAAAPN